MKQFKDEYDSENPPATVEELREKLIAQLGRNILLTTTLSSALDGIDSLSNVLADMKDGELTIEAFKKSKSHQKRWKDVCKLWHSCMDIKERVGLGEMK